MIVWYQRCKRQDTQVSERLVLQSHCGRYKVEESSIKYGRTHKRNGDYNGYPTVYWAMVLMDWGWRIISIHRKRKTAIGALEYYDEHGHKMPPKKKKRKKVKHVSNS